MKKPKFKDFPFAKITAAALAHAREGKLVFQKWTCAGCGARLYGKPGHWFTEGRCDEVDGKMGCGTITNIAKQGCNFGLVVGLTPEGVAGLGPLAKAILGDTEGPQ